MSAGPVHSPSAGPAFFGPAMGYGKVFSALPQAMSAAMARPPSGRLAKALAASALLHFAVLFGFGHLTSARSIPEPSIAELTVRLELRLPAVARQNNAPHYQTSSSADSHAGVERQREISANNDASSAPRFLVPGFMVSAALPSKERYYATHELDVVAKPVNDVLLRYPRQAFEKRIGGEVRVRLLINRSGHVDKVDVVRAEPEGAFDQAAREAAQQLHFSPAMRNGQAVNSEKLIAIVFDPTPDPLR